jgi:F-type H+-transporting ATPase subunit gamma
MGLVASSKIRRANEALTKSRQYRKAYEKIIRSLCTSGECRKTAYMKEREGGKKRILVIAGDRGLAGGYNANVFRLARNYEDADFIPVGKRAVERFGGEFYSSEYFTPADALKIAKKLCADFREEKYSEFDIIYTEYVSMLSQEAKIKKILPLSREDDGKKGVGMIFEPDERTILEQVIPDYVAGMIMDAVRESFASEVAARRMAMDSAGKNAGEMIDKLSLEYNRARQGAITQEITEIVAGSGE